MAAPFFPFPSPMIHKSGNLRIYFRILIQEYVILVKTVINAGVVNCKCSDADQILD